MVTPGTPGDGTKVTTFRAEESPYPYTPENPITQ